MDRAPLRSLLGFASLIGGCAGKESPPESADAPVEARTEVVAAEASAGGAEARATQAKLGGPPGQCVGLLLADDRSIQHRGQGSHAAATTDVTLDLTTGRLRGQDYKLGDDGNTPIPLTVDQQVAPEVLAALREHMESSCAPRRIASADEASAPGGSTTLEIKHADGSSLFVLIGAATIPAGSTVASPSREDWATLFELWPRPEGK